MDLVIDANIIISSLISIHGKNFDLIFNERVNIYAPEFLLEEVKNYKNEIISKAQISESDFNIFLSIISSKIEIIPKEEFSNFREQAKIIKKSR